MPSAIVRTEQGYAGVSFAGHSLPAVVREIVPLDRLSPTQANRAAWAVSLPDCTLVRTSLPLLKGNALRRAVELQNSFQFPQWGLTSVAGVHLAESPRSVEYLLCGFDAPRNLRPSRALPEPLAFAALADALGMVPETGTVLIVCAGATRLWTVLVTDRQIGLMRDVARPADISLELRLSMQQAYLTPHPAMVSAERIVWFGETAVLDRLQESLRAIATVVPVEKLLESMPPGSVLSELLAAAGMVVAGKSGNWVASWYMEPRKDSVATVMRRVALWLLPLLAVLFAAYTGFEVWLEQQDIRRYNENIAQVQTGYAAVERLRQQYGNLMAFRQDAGRTMTSVSTWENVFAQLSEGRPDGVRLRTVNGNLEQRLTVLGEAEHFGQVAEYMKTLKGKALFGNLALRSSTDNSEGNRSRVSFAFEVDWEEASRGHR
ncbi:MAG: hypothetical protein A3K19_07030 [Lentisphaerae bacterium RIFOXYB12_FULL_65_16]|nr:MAG: hypothetical protein A3K18_12295 [Lentisphaerae bacterium RIFOXYA12_64_32]OGV93275.1 MAG: hypothetical protein A3K19_07030 [Lentisphaerae bacterium RIFOXYB12_FULL_65_16]